jgi:hypothetical protein
MKTSRSVSIMSLTVAVGLALTGCSLPGTIPLGSPPVLIGDATQGQTDRSASVSGSRMCVINNATATMSILWQGYSDARDIPSGGRNCNSGYETSNKDDVSATISYVASDDAGTVHELHVAANNNWLWTPEASAVVYLPDETKKGLCRPFTVGQARFVETGWLRGEMTRINDSADNKEFEFILTDKVGDVVGEDC